MKEIIKIKFRPVEPVSSQWDINVYPAEDGELDSISDIGVIITAFNDAGIANPDEMLFEYIDSYRDRCGDYGNEEYRFYYRKDGYEEAVIQHEKDVEVWHQWKLDNVGDIKAENSRKKKLRAAKKEANEKAKLKKDIAATEAKLSQLKEQNK